MSRRVRVVVGLVVAIATVPGLAIAAWGASGIGDSSARAVSMPAGATPSVSASGRNVTVSWAQATLPDTTPVAGYEIKRYDGASNPQTVLSACSGTITALTCTENAVPAGTWRYTVTPRQAGWRGAESSQSAAVVIAAPSLSLTAPTWITSLPAVLPATVTNFASFETVTFRLDDPTTGPILTPTPDPFTVPASGTLTGTVRIPNGTSDGTHTVYAVGSINTTASAGIKIDRTAPSVTNVAVIKTQDGTANFVKQAGTYRVYANASDAQSGVSTVTANVSTLTTGATSVALSSGSWTIRGVTYGYRSAIQTANSPLSEGAKSFTVTATDIAGNATSPNGSATVDNTAPIATDVQGTNNSGGLAGRADTGDRLTLSFSEPIEPESILAGWDGTATTVTVRFTNAGGSDDRILVYDAANTTQLPLGTVRLSDSLYVLGNVSFTGSTMTTVGSAVVVTLGVPDLPLMVGISVVPGAARYTPDTAMYDRAANACSNATANESGANDVEF
jgi:hypothetical protein